MKASIFSGASTISITIGRSCESSSSFAVWMRLCAPKPMKPFTTVAPAIMPKTRHPTRFTPNVPIGKSEPDSRSSAVENAYRATEPSAPPAAISSSRTSLQLRAMPAIQRQRLSNDRECVARTEDIVDCRRLVLECLVVLEETADLPENVSRQLRAVAVVGERG